jgi:hypothetical protein
VSVTNLSANRIRDLDVRGVPWKKFYNVNFPVTDCRLRLTTTADCDCRPACRLTMTDDGRLTTDD